MNLINYVISYAVADNLNRITFLYILLDNEMLFRIGMKLSEFISISFYLTVIAIIFPFNQ